MSRRRPSRWAVAVATSVLLLVAVSADAHKPSDSYLTLASVGAADLDVRWDIAVRDLDRAVGLDRDGDGVITWGEVRAAEPALDGYSASRLTVRRGGRICAGGPISHRLVGHTDGAYVVLSSRLQCPVPAAAEAAIEVDYRLLFDVDPQHRGIAHIADRGGQTAIFEIDHPTARIALGRPAPSRELAVAIRAGVRHIWTGYDHLLFLLALLLPCMLSRTPAGGWQGVSSIGAAVRRIAAVVTAFTLAHSLTLSLAALDLMQLPSRLVESLIAASVAAAAVNNLLPAARAHGWFLAFALGLLHGFGFAGALTDAGLSGARLALTLLGFNLGVELGQLTIVALFVPLAFAARNTVGYRRVLLLGGSGAIAVVAVVWFVERAFT